MQTTEDVRRIQPDRGLFLLTTMLVVVGLAMVFSATTALALDQNLSPFHFVLKQVIAALLGFVLIRFLLRFDYAVLSAPKVYMTVLLVAVGLLVVVLFTPPVNNTNRWLQLAMFSFQPSEAAKPALIIVLAAVASRWRDMLSSWGFIFLVLAVFVAPVVFLVAVEPDLGTAAVVAMVSLAVLFAGGIGMRKLIVLLLICAVGIGLFIYSSPYRINRIIAYLDPGADPLGAGFQSTQSEIALGAGGLWGEGFMESKQKLFYLPAAQTDFIFSVLGEEWGLIGSTLVICLFLAFFIYGIRIAFSARDLFGFLIAVGVTTMVAGQAMMNISVATTLIPTKGIPLPFISYGGSSLVMMLAAVGLLLNVSQYCRKE